MSPRSTEFMDQTRDRAEAGAGGACVRPPGGLRQRRLLRNAVHGPSCGDYEAVTPSEEDARRYVDGAADFITAIEEMLDAPQIEE